MTATFTVSFGPIVRAAASSDRLGIPSARPAAIEFLKKLRRGNGFISLLLNGWVEGDLAGTRWPFGPLACSSRA
jgi:hypothetical protein